MTMLDHMRRHRGWLKWTLALVVLTFVAFYVPAMNEGPASTTETVAEVDGDPITVGEFRRSYSGRMQQIQMQGGGLTPELLRSMGFDKQILQQLIDQRAVAAEARRRGLTVTDAEVRESILRSPGFQENGRFVGYQRYSAVLRAQRPPLTEEEFEELVRGDLLAQKLQAAVTGWIVVADAEADAEYRRRNEKVKLEVVHFPVDQFRDGVTASDAEIAAFFEKDKERYRIGERRKIRYVTVDTQALRQTITPTPEQIQAYYTENRAQYTNPEQVRASHILFKTEGKDAAAVRKQAEAVLAQVKAGGDFAALARTHSEDEASKVNGGDLNFFGRGSMVKPFEDAAFSLAPGQTSDLVESSFGFHIIRVIDKRPAGERPLAEVRDQIGEQLKWQQAQDRATQVSGALEARVKQPSDLDAAAKEHGLTVKESPFFQRNDPVGDLGPAPQVSNEAFTLKDGAVSGPIRTAQGFVLFAVSGKEAPRVPALEEVKEKVRSDVVTDKAKEAARSKAAELAAAVKAGTPLAAAAKAAGREVKTTELVARGSVLADVGVSPAVDRVAFELPVAAVSDPVVTDTGAAVVRVVEKTGVTDAELATARESIRRELAEQHRNRFFSAYMEKAKEKLEITTYPDTLARVLGT